MFRLTIRRFMHDRKIPNITSSHVYPSIKSSFESPKKYDYYKPKGKRKWWSDYLVWWNSRQTRKYYPGIYSGRLPEFFTADDIIKRNYKATHGDGSPIELNSRPISSFDCENELWTSNVDSTGTVVPTKPHEHAEAEEKSIAEEEAIWGDISTENTDLDGVENEYDDCLQDDKFKKLFERKLPK